MIQPPNFQKDAIPTPQGWRHPRTGELLVSRKISEEAIAEYFGSSTPEAEMLTESPTNFQEAKAELMTDDTLPSEYESMTKKELEALGIEIGILLDTRKNKAALIEELKEAL